MRFLLSAMVLMLASAAAAQTLTLSVTGDTEAGDSVSADGGLTTKRCGQEYSVAWQLNRGVAFTDSSCKFKIWVTDATTCQSSIPDDSTANQRLLETIPSNWQELTNGTVSAKLEVDTGQSPYGTKFPTLACGNDEEKKFLICGAFQYPGGIGSGACGSSQAATSPAVITYDTKPPSKPTIDKVTALDGGLHVGMVSQDGVDSFFANVEGPDNFSRKDLSFDRKPSLRIGGLTNFTEYTITVYAKDAVGNPSPLSDSVKETPIKTDGFIERYEGMNGGETGGCAVSTGGSLLSLIGLLPLLARRSRRR